ncbi:MAG TPA: maltotransferase domain-containing protein, partial [Acidisoma sp.]|nr:maltotransferase domain-containing protein [Acidisoma sp.]
MTVQSNITKTAPEPLGSLPPGGQAAPRIYQFHPLDAGPMPDWPAWFDHAAGLGFTHVLSAPFFAGPSLHLVRDFNRSFEALGGPASAQEALRLYADAARASGLIPLLDLYPGRVSAEHTLGPATERLFLRPAAEHALDPRAYPALAGAAQADWAGEAEGLASFWSGLLAIWQETGLAGFRIDLRQIAAEPRPSVLQALRSAVSGELFGWTPGLPWAEVRALDGAGLDFVFSSLPWWDFRAEWFWEEAERLATLAPAIAPVEDPFGTRLAAAIGDLGELRRAQRRVVNFASATGHGLLMPMGFEIGATRSWDTRRGAPVEPAVSPDLRAILRQANLAPQGGSTTRIGSPNGEVLALMRSAADLRFASGVELTFFNPSQRRRAAAPIETVMTALGGHFLPDTEMAEPVFLEPGSIATLRLHAQAAQPRPVQPLEKTVEAASAAGLRIAIEAVSPAVDGGRFPVKRVAGEIVTVTADLLCDGHDQLAAALHWRRKDVREWRQARFAPIVNDRWQAQFFLADIGTHEFFVEVWRDAYATYRDELGKKHRAGVDVTVELMEGRK